MSDYSQEIDNEDRVRTIALFGASGRTGQAVIESAHRKGLRIKALYRPGSEPRFEWPGIEVFTGQLVSMVDVGRIMKGCDSVCCVFGPRRNNPKPFCTTTTVNIIASMRESGISRIVCQTGAMIGDDVPNWSFMVRSMVRSYRKRWSELAADRREQEKIVKNSGLDWTLVKPPRISDSARRLSVKADPDMRITMFSSVGRGDLADFICDELVAGRFHRRAVYVKK